MINLDTYKRLYREISRLTETMDPGGLGGAKNEYDGPVNEIIKLKMSEDTASLTGSILMKIFQKYFGTDVIVASSKEFIELAEKIQLL